MRRVQSRSKYRTSRHFPRRVIRALNHEPLKTAARHLYLTGLERDVSLPEVLAPFSRLFYRHDMRRAKWGVGAEFTRAVQKDRPLWSILSRWEFADVYERGGVVLTNHSRDTIKRNVRLRTADILSGHFVHRSFRYPVKRVRRAI